jgi:hypothetical protein
MVPMPRNTFILVLLLAFIAGIVVIVNIFIKPSLRIVDTQSTTPTPSVVPTPILVFYENEPCRFSFQYPDTFSAVDLEAGGGAVFISKTNEEEKLTFFCQENLPEPKEMEGAQEYTVGTISALLKQSEATSTAEIVERLYFEVPGTENAVLLSGTPTIFRQVLTSLYLR